MYFKVSLTENLRWIMKMNLQKLNKLTYRITIPIQTGICFVILIAGVIGYFKEVYNLDTFLLIMIIGLIGLEFATIKNKLNKIEEKVGI